MSNRKSDIRGEKALGLFLDRYFYPDLCETKGLADPRRIFDVKEQKQGADIQIIDSSGEDFIIDEKAQLHFINKPKDTFAFEVSYYSDENDKVLDGWLVNANNITTHYILIWIDSARTEQLNRIVADDFNEITVALISKNRIINYLEQMGFPIKRIKKIARDLRFAKNNNYYKLPDDAFIYYTTKEGYDEKPINVVIQRKALLKMADGVYKVDRKACQKVPIGLDDFMDNNE